MTNNLQSTSTSILLWMLTATAASAQIIPDATLPKNTTATPNGNTIIIDGCTRSGTNLFHSFREFNLGNGSTAFFNNRADIGNIISRVTGGNLSNGEIRVTGDGNSGTFPDGGDGLAVSPGRTLALVGGDVTMRGGIVRTPNQPT